MQILRGAVLILSLSAVFAARTNRKREGSETDFSVNSEGGKTCKIVENDHSLKYGVKGSWQVPNCLRCKFHQFLTITVPQDLIRGADLDEEGNHCKCKTAPKFWEAEGLDQKFWFQFHIGSQFPCDVATCKQIFFNWADGFNKKKAYPGDNEKFPADKSIGAQEGYDLTCDESEAEGLHLPSPASKILELRLQIERCTDPDEKAKLEELLRELLQDKQVEVFAYELEGDWGPEHETDASSDDEHHSYFLKPCKSQNGREITELHEIIELCGEGVLGESMKHGEVQMSYGLDDDWGPERVCNAAEEECQLVQNQAKDDEVEGEILTFRLKPCKSPNGKEITELSEIVKDKGGCGIPRANFGAAGSKSATLLPVKMDMTSKFDKDADFDEGTKMKFPCDEE